MKRKTEIYSIFGQIESVVADAMAEEGLVHRIERDMIPVSARFNEKGEVAHCAIVLSPELEIAFNKRVADLRV